jgi:hypothetical protein
MAKAGRVPTMEEVAKQMARRMGREAEEVLGVLTGMEVLISYAEGEMKPEETALEEEQAGLAAAQAAVRPLVQKRLQRRLDEADEQIQEVRCPGCRQKMESQGRRERTWLSTVGELTLVRGYQWCERCKAGRAVAQEKVGLPDSDATAGLEHVGTLMATTVPHEMASAMVKQVLGVEISAKGIKSMVARRGQAVGRQMDQDAQEIQAFEEQWGRWPEVGLSEGTTPAPEVVYLEADGVTVPVRQPVEQKEPAVRGRGGKGRRYELAGREVKNAILYPASACAQESESRGCLLEKTYLSHLGEWLPLALMIWTQMLKRGYDRAKQVVVLSDGAEWIRSLCAWLPVPVWLILDLYHVKRRIWDVAEVLYGSGTPEARQWAQSQCQRIEDGRAIEVIDTLAGLKQRLRKAREQIDSLQTYLTNNLDRMDYPAYRAAGLRVGSGAIESTNYHVTGARLKLPGMRWSETGAAHMARLRTDLFNGLWQQRTRQLLKAA